MIEKGNILVVEGLFSDSHRTLLHNGQQAMESSSDSFFFLFLPAEDRRIFVGICTVVRSKFVPFKPYAVVGYIL